MAVARLIGRRAVRGRGTAYTVRSLVRGLSILAQLADGPMRLTDLSAALKVDKATLFRYCTTLAQLKYLDVENSTKTYSLGPMARTIGYASLNQKDALGAIRTWLQPLADRFRGSSSFGALDKLEAVYIERAVADGALIWAMSAGARLPALKSSMGKILVAELSPVERKRLLTAARLESRERVKLEKELTRAAEKGYALNLGAFRQGLNAVAVAVKEPVSRRTLGALMVASYEFTEDDLTRIVPVLRDVAERAGRGEPFAGWGRATPVLTGGKDRV